MLCVIVLLVLVLLFAPATIAGDAKAKLFWSLRQQAFEK